MMFESEQPEAEQPEGIENEQNEWLTLESQAAAYDKGATVSTSVEGEPVEFATADLLSPLLSSGFALLCPKWEVEQEESDALAQSWGAVVDTFFPSVNVDPRVAVVVGAVASTAMVIGPRMGKPRTEKEAKRLEKKKVEQAKPEREKLPVNDKPVDPVKITLD
ncbi:hypothetical protein [Neptunicella sp. SCSIO 80796]|uniref:hypothetical protein n=1 Tax=Neptunicella plasticusilytica TaxID=3117012 RepID=UPI003A4DCB41